MSNIFWVLALFAAPASAQDAPKPLIKVVRPTAPPSFGMPVRCTYGTDCWILNYADFGPEGDGNPQDPLCFNRTYDGHKGTDFAVRDEAAMRAGVDVLAAADGTVARTREGEPDRFPTKEELEQVKAARKECGNAVLIEHKTLGDGKWQTMYCHLKKGSVTVKPGDSVKKGQKIAQMGLSGMTEFPHLHFGLTHGGKVIDPFTGADLHGACGTGKDRGTSLWDSGLGLAYEPLVPLAAGFGTAAPTLEEMDKAYSRAEKLPRDIPALLFHAVVLGAREGDDVNMLVRAPDGSVFAQNRVRQEKNRARQLYYLGREITAARTLQKGTYTGELNIKRAGIDGKSQTFSIGAGVVIE